MNQHAIVRQKMIIYGVVFAALIGFRLLMRGMNWQISHGVQAFLEFTVVSSALFVGTFGLVRFYTHKEGVYFLLSIGFLGAGLLDGYHLLATDFESNLLRTLDEISAYQYQWRWTISAVFLSILTVGSWLIWFRSSKEKHLSRPLMLFAAAVFILNLLYFASVPYIVALADIYDRQNMVIAVSATFFLIALLGYWQKRLWPTDPFEHWLILFLIIIYSSQTMYMVFARTPYDIYFVAAIFLRLLSYICVLIGLLISMYSIFKRAEAMAAEQSIINEVLQLEVAERTRVEASEHEQRQLAEALREVGIALSSVLDFDRLLNLLLDQIARVMPYDTANVMLVHGDTIEIGVTRGYGQDLRLGVPQRFSISKMPSLQQMVDTEKPLIISNTAVHDLWVDPEESPHVHSWAGAPISVKGEVIAFLALNNSQSDFYQPEAAAILSAFAGQAAAAFDNVHLYEEVSQRAEELNTLSIISQAISSTLDLPETLAIITQNTVRLLHVEAASVVLLDEAVGDLVFAAASGRAANFVKGQRLKIGQGVIGWVVENGEPVLVPQTKDDDRYFDQFDIQSGFQAKTILCVPLKSKDQTIGALEALNKEKGELFNEEDMSLLTRLATPAANAIENARLFAQAQQEITERVRIEAALEAERSLLARRVAERTADLSTANTELARAARLKDEFLASMSHELRTPLNAVLGISEALQEEVFGPMNERQISSLQSIEESGRHLLALINDILDLSKIGAGKLELELMPVPVESVCQASLRLIKQDAHKKRLRIHSSYDSAVTLIQADERRLKQMLVNLLSNAVKFTPEGGQIGLEVVGDEAGQMVQLTVWDSGIGVTEEDMLRLFQPFVQLDSRLAREYAGTGLGLSLVQRMTELHGGTVAVESRPREGSRFTISLPWQGDPVNLVADSHGATREFLQIGTLRQVLVVDDSPAATEQISRYLREFQIEAVTHPVGKGTVKLVLALRPDVIVLDILLPDMSGWDVLAALQSNEETRPIPVLVASVVDERENALASGAADCLLKPVSRIQLQMALHRILQLNEWRTGVVGNTAVKPRILLAEDNLANINTFSYYLAAKGYEIIVAQNGEEAVQQAQQEKPDLILMDIQMPKMNGLEAIQAIRADALLERIPIIAVTALAMPGDEEACLAAGANDYLSKPVRLKGLLEAIQAQLGERRMTDESMEADY
ncbi:MAG: response regulator [Chloroflexi bacterium]|nr:response regulator [Chloroflexota bacterium]